MSENAIKVVRIADHGMWHVATLGGYTRCGRHIPLDSHIVTMDEDAWRGAGGICLTCGDILAGVNGFSLRRQDNSEWRERFFAFNAWLDEREEEDAAG